MNVKRQIFTKKMKKTHTILLPSMLPIHFKFLQKLLENYGYKAKLLENKNIDNIVKVLETHQDQLTRDIIVLDKLFTLPKLFTWYNPS